MEHGGPGLDVTSRFILTEELELSGAPHLSPFGLVMVGPLLMQFGTDAQKKRFLPKILAGEEVWCQGYSEPNAGSDLASLKLRAEDDGKGHFVMNGQKTWTTYAQYADWIFCLARTEPGAKKQEGIGFILVDMKTPGVTAKPFLTTGGTPAFSETFFENAVVPKENLVGPLTGGWTIAKALLGHERTLIAAVGQSARTLRRVKRLARQTMSNGKSLIDDPGFRAKLARMEVKLRSLQMANYRALASAQLGHAPGPRGVDPEDPRLGDPPAVLRARDGGHRPRLARVVQRAGRRPRQRAVGRLGLQLHARDDDLRRVQRDPEERHCQVDSRTAVPMRPAGSHLP